MRSVRGAFVGLAFLASSVPAFGSEPIREVRGIPWGFTLVRDDRGIPRNLVFRVGDEPFSADDDGSVIVTPCWNPSSVEETYHWLDSPYGVCPSVILRASGNRVLRAEFRSMGRPMN
jgi:hypothetical protein